MILHVEMRGGIAMAFATIEVLLYTIGGSRCRLVAVPAFKAVRGAIALSPVGSISTPSAILCPAKAGFFSLPASSGDGIFHCRSAA